MSENIGRDNFYKFTDGHFTPCPVPDREPDYHSKSSSYWFSKEGVIRQSDHWGRGIAACTWTLGEEPEAPCFKNKGLGQRCGFISWNDFHDPDRTVKVTHQFGTLDYDKLGVLPIENGHDDFGDFDVFPIKREWFIEDASHFTFAGRTLQASFQGQSFISALGDAYKDPQAQAISLAWNDCRLDAKANGEKQPDLDAWLKDQAGNPAYGSLARSLSESPKRTDDDKYAGKYTLSSVAKSCRSASDRLASEPAMDVSVAKDVDLR